MQEEFVYPETAVGDVLGIPKKRLRAIRRNCGLRDGEHFRTINRSLVYSVHGMKLLLRCMGTVGNGDFDEMCHKILIAANGSYTEGEGTTTAIVHLERPVCEMIVHRADWLNSRIITALLGGVQQRVNVTSSKNFVRGMRIKARRIEGDLWQLQGRCPRYRGRW